MACKQRGGSLRHSAHQVAPSYSNQVSAGGTPSLPAVRVRRQASEQLAPVDRVGTTPDADVVRLGTCHLEGLHPDTDEVVRLAAEAARDHLRVTGTRGTHGGRIQVPAGISLEFFTTLGRLPPVQ